MYINDPHLSGFPAGIGTAALRGCRALNGPVPIASLDKHELIYYVSRFYLSEPSLSIAEKDRNIPVNSIVSAKR